MKKYKKRLLIVDVQEYLVVAWNRLPHRRLITFFAFLSVLTMLTTIAVCGFANATLEHTFNPRWTPGLVAGTLLAVVFLTLGSLCLMKENENDLARRLTSSGTAGNLK